MKCSVSKQFTVIPSCAPIVTWRFLELEVVTKWSAVIVKSTSVTSATKHLIHQIHMDISGKGGPVNCSHKKWLTIGNHESILARKYNKYMRNSFTSVAQLVLVVANLMWRLETIITCYVGHAKAITATYATRLWGAGLNIMDQKVANSTLKDSISTMPWTIFSLASWNVILSLNYFMSNEFCNTININWVCCDYYQIFEEEENQRGSNFRTRSD